MARKFVPRLVALLMVITTFAGWNTTFAQEGSVSLAQNEFAMSAVRSCEGNALELQWIAENADSIDFSLSNTSDGWTSGWISLVDVGSNNHSQPVEHAYDKISILVTYSDLSTESHFIDVGQCGVVAHSTTSSGPGTEEPLTISGTVTDDSGNPLEGVLVRVWNWSQGPELDAYTDADGRYAFLELPERYSYQIGTFSLYEPGIALFRAPVSYNPYLEWSDGDVTFDFVFTRVDFGSVSGAITDMVGNPIADSTVCYFFQDYNEAEPLVNICSESGVDGVFALSAPLHPDFSTELEISSEECSTRGVTIPAGSAGSLETGDITLDCGETLSVYGTVRDDSGNPLEGVQVRVRDSSIGPDLTTLTSADGTYSFVDLPIREYYQLFANTLIVAGEALYRAPATEYIGWSAGELTVDFVLTRYDVATISGVIKDETGAPLDGFRLCLLGPIEESTGPAGGTYAWDQVCKTDFTNGVFSFPDSPSGEYELSAEIWGNPDNFNTYRIEYAVTVESADVVQDIVFVRASSDPATIFGVVVDEDGNPIEGAGICHGKQSIPFMDGCVVTESDGSYLIETATFGEYRLRVYAVGYFEVYPVLVIDQDPFEANVVLSHRGTAAGTITDMNGIPVEGASICYNAGKGEIICAESGEDGRFAIGAYLSVGYALPLTITAENCTTTFAQVTGSAGGFVEIGTIQLSCEGPVEPGDAEVRGQVVDGEGDPLEGATVCLDDSTNCTITDEEGYYSLTFVDELPGAGGTFTASLDGYESQSQFVTGVIPGREVVANFILTPIDEPGPGPKPDLSTLPDPLLIERVEPIGEAPTCEAPVKLWVGQETVQPYVDFVPNEANDGWVPLLGSSTEVIPLEELVTLTEEEVEECRPDDEIVEWGEWPAETPTCENPSLYQERTNIWAEPALHEDGLTWIPGAGAQYELVESRTLELTEGESVGCNPVVELSTDRVQPAASVGWTASEAGPEAEITIEWVTVTGGVIALGMAVADGTGDASGSFPAPATPGGDGHTVRFTIGSRIVELPISVAARISPTPSTAAPGQAISVNLRGFAAFDQLTILWRVNGAWVSMGTVTSSATGSVTGMVLTVPANADAGPNTIRVGGTISQQSSLMTVIRPSAALESERATVGTKVGFTLADFPANSEVSVSWIRTNGATIERGTVQTDANGAATGLFEVPATEGGPGQQVRFTSGGTTATATFDIASRIRVTPAVARPGETVSLNLRGFKASDSLRIMWMNEQGAFVQVATATTTSTGSVTGLEIVVPSWAPNGVNKLRANGVISQQTSALTVERPTVTVSPVSGTVNTRIVYELEGFGGESEVTITWHRLTGGTVPIGTVTTNEDGTATGNFVIPATPGGADQLVTFTAGGATATALIEVKPRIKVTPGVAAPGETVDISLRGLPRQEAYVIRWRAGTTGPFIVLTSGTTSSTGSANIPLTIPLSAVEGPYQVRVEMAPYNLQTNAFSVEEGD